MPFSTYSAVMGSIMLSSWISTTIGRPAGGLSEPCSAPEPATTATTSWKINQRSFTDRFASSSPDFQSSRSDAGRLDCPDQDLGRPYCDRAPGRLGGVKDRRAPSTDGSRRSRQASVRRGIARALFGGVLGARRPAPEKGELRRCRVRSGRLLRVHGQPREAGPAG